MNRESNWQGVESGIRGRQSVVSLPRYLSSLQPLYITCHSILDQKQTPFSHYEVHLRHRPRGPHLRLAHGPYRQGRG